jgi:hypothetical protein
MNSGRTLFFAFGLSLVFCLTGQTATVLSENFDELTPVLSATATGAFSTIGGTNVDIVGGGLFGGLCRAPESGNCIDLDGSGGNPQGILLSNSTFGPGAYDLSFDLIGSDRGNATSTTVTFGSYSQTFSLASADVTSGIVSNQLVNLTSAAYLTFTSNTPGDEGALLDNVLISSGPVTFPTVPEPASILLTLPALLVGYVLRRRSKV